MAQKMETRADTRLRENLLGEVQKGKAVAHGGITRARCAMGRLGQTSKPEFPIDKEACKAAEYVALKDPQQFVQVSDIDSEDLDKEYACAEYAKKISHYLKSRESIYQVPADYIESQAHINERMRAILVDWLAHVHERFRLLPGTLFLTVSLLDRYLTVDTKVEKTNLQLVGVSAMLLASKIEEIYTPEITDFVYITDNAYTPAQIRACESKIAALLEFNFGDPLCITFLRRNSKAAKADADKHTLAKFFMELMLPDYESLVFPPSQRAASALCLAMKVTDNSPWDATAAHYSHYEEPALVPCMKKIAKLVLKSKNPESKLLSVSDKYKDKKFLKISSSPCLTSKFIFILAED